MQVFGYPIHSISIQVNCNSPKRAHAVSLQKVDSSRQEITRTVPSLLIPTSYLHEYHNFSSNLHSIGYLASCSTLTRIFESDRDTRPRLVLGSFHHCWWMCQVSAFECSFANLTMLIWRLLQILFGLALPIARLSVVSISGQAPMCKYFDALARVNVRMLMGKVRVALFLLSYCSIRSGILGLILIL